MYKPSCRFNDLYFHLSINTKTPTTAVLHYKLIYIDHKTESSKIKVTRGKKEERTKERKKEKRKKEREEEEVRGVKIN